ncbi:DUF2857 domain-containing protein [Saezia sanguinis]|uniref:DUF2857 domain-containing protein n=1 Tax=Saezia sanguinis TaxID=1965230 RepID=UPI00305C99E7
MEQFPLNQAVISQILFDLRQGTLRRSLQMGFTEDDLRLLRDQDKVEVLLNTTVSWLDVKVNTGIMRRLAGQVSRNHQEVALIDRALEMGASSKMIADLFGLNQREVAFRKRMLNIDEKRGRWQELTETQDHQLWRQWKDMIKNYHLDIHDQMDMLKICMALTRASDIPLAMIWQAQERWMDAEEKPVTAMEQENDDDA